MQHLHRSHIYGVMGEFGDPEELIHAVEKIRAAGWQTAAEFTWPEAIENLAGKLGYLARKQSIVLE